MKDNTYEVMRKWLLSFRR